MSSTDKIEKVVTLRAPVSRVWRAISDSKEFSQWFGFDLDGPFVVGKRMTGTFRGVIDEAALIEHQRSAGVKPSGLRRLESGETFCTVERIEPERFFSFRWIPYGVDEEADVENEPTTLVEFSLEPTVDGTRLTIVESGFDRVPEHRRARAFRMNEGGWAAQAQNIGKHVDGA